MSPCHPAYSGVNSILRTLFLRFFRFFSNVPFGFFQATALVTAAVTEAITALSYHSSLHAATTLTSRQSQQQKGSRQPHTQSKN